MKLTSFFEHDEPLFLYTTSNKLRSLRTEIKNYYFFLHINVWVFK